MTVEVRFYTDPACSWSWGAEPMVRHLQCEFGDQLSFRWVMGGLARELGPDYRDEEGRIGYGPSSFLDLLVHWLDVSSRTGMPCDPRLWLQNPIRSTYPASMAVKAASEQGPHLAYRYLRRLREGLLVERKKLDHAEALIAEAGPAGLDVERFRIDLSSHAITEAFAADMQEARAISEEARAAGAVRETEGRERLPFPSAVFSGGDGGRKAVWGWQPYESYRGAARAAGASPLADPMPGVLELVERFGRVATEELGELTGQPRPLLEAELWGHAAQWRLRPQSALMGTFWERA